MIGLLGLLFGSCNKNPHDKTRHNNEQTRLTNPHEEPTLKNESINNRAIHLTGEIEKQVDIKTAEVRPGAVKSTLQAMGKVLAPNNRKALVGFACSARIAKLHASVGTWVKEGQPLVTLMCEEVGNAQCDYVKALTDYELAKLDSDREERLFKKDIGAKKEYLAARASYHIARASLKAAEEKLYVIGLTKKQIAEISRTKSVTPNVTVKAPISGRIVRNHAVLGALIDSSSEIMTIVDLTDIWIDAEIYEKDLSKVKLGQEVEIVVPAYPGEKFLGKIHYIGDLVDPDTRTITVRTKVVNRDFKLKPGMFADINILMNHKAQAVIVPKQALLDDGDLHILFVRDTNETNHFICRVVEVGTVFNGDVEILKGLSLGEQVVIEGNYQLKSKLREGTLKSAHVH